MSRIYSIGVDLGGTKVRIGLMNEIGILLNTLEIETESHKGPEYVIDRMVEHIRLLISPEYRPNITGVGIGSPGPLNPKTGTIINAPNLPGWDHLPLAKLISDEISLPVLLDNDANVAALAENRYGAGRGSENMIYLTVSTGIGAGIIIDGELYYGKTGASGEIGHMMVDAAGPRCKCGQMGCLETLASGTAISSSALSSLGIAYNASELYEMELSGNKKAEELLDTAFSHLAVGIVNIVRLFDPERIVIGGGVTLMGDPFFSKLLTILNRDFQFSKHTVDILPVELGRDSGVIGAASLPFSKNRVRF